MTKKPWESHTLVRELRRLGSLPSTTAINADTGVHATLHEAADKIIELEGLLAKTRRHLR